MPITITVPGLESWDDENEVFVNTPETVLTLEHSLVSVSKWEAIFNKPFLGKEKKSTEETYAYIHCMCLDENVGGEVLLRLSNENFEAINNYIESKMTATTFIEGPNKASREIITNEVIRHWMIALQIPIEYETRHLNHLFTVIKVVSEKNKPPKKMSAAALAARNRELNAQRQKQYGTSG